jgi:flagellar protein FlgJ
MDIDSLRSFNANNISINDASVNRIKNAANDIANFEKLLRRTMEPEAATPEKTQPSDAALPNEAASSKFAVIDRAGKLYEQCLELEIFMVKTLIGSMRNTIQKSGLIEEGFAGKMYEDMLYDEYARDFTKNANFGMADLAYLELTGQRGKTIKNPS